VAYFRKTSIPLELRLIKLKFLRHFNINLKVNCKEKEGRETLLNITEKTLYQSLQPAIKYQAIIISIKRILFNYRKSKE